MGRIRTVKPDLFTHEGLYGCESESGLPTTLAFIALFCVADREGRFKWRPRELKLHCLPYHDLDFAAVLEALRIHGFIIRYEVDGEFYGVIPTFTKHQVVNNREMASKLPAPPPDTKASQTLTPEARVSDASGTLESRGFRGTGTGRELELEGKKKVEHPPPPPRGNLGPLTQSETIKADFLFVSKEGKAVAIHEEQFIQYQKNYPTVDVRGRFAELEEYFSVPEWRKPHKEIPRLIQFVLENPTVKPPYVGRAQ